MSWFVRIPALIWVMLSYALLASAFQWSGRQSDVSLAGWVFMGCLGLSWLPLYVFLNRSEILREKAFWFSHASAALIAVIAFVMIYFWMEPTIGGSGADPHRPVKWLALLGNITFFYSLHVIKWLAAKVQKHVERLLSVKQSQD